MPIAYTQSYVRQRKSKLCQIYSLNASFQLEIMCEYRLWPLLVKSVANIQPL